MELYDSDQISALTAITAPIAPPRYAELPINLDFDITH